MIETNNQQANRTVPEAALRRVLRHLETDEALSYAQAPSPDHVFLSIAEIRNWLFVRNTKSSPAVPFGHLGRLLDYAWEDMLVDSVTSGDPGHVYWSVALVAHWMNAVRPGDGNPDDPAERGGWRSARLYLVPEGFSFL